jgi:hypothetical protein
MSSMATRCCDVSLAGLLGIQFELFLLIFEPKTNPFMSLFPRRVFQHSGIAPKYYFIRQS